MDQVQDPELEPEFNEEEEEDIVNYSPNEYEDLTREHGIKLKEGLYIRELLENKGTVFETILPEQLDEVHTNNSYFDDEDIVKHLNPAMYGVDEDENEGTFFNQISSKMVDITDGNGGVLKQVIRKGHGQQVTRGAIVTIHYNAYIEYADEPFDSTYVRKSPLRIQLQTTSEGCSLVIGLELGILTMCVKEMADFLVQPNYAYGAMGCQPRIPGNAVILYRVELLDMLDYGAATEFERLSLEERREARFESVYAAAKEEHSLGNHSVCRKNFSMAIKSYEKAVLMLEHASLRNQEDHDAQQKLLLNLYLNLALCYLKSPKKPIKVLSLCKKAVRIDDKNIKAYYRRGIAKMELGEYIAAREALIRAKRLAPNSKEINSALIDLEKKECEYREKEKLMYAAMLKKPSSDTEIESKPSSVRAPDVPDTTCDSENFKIYIRKRLNDFCRDKSLKEIRYPGELSFTELQCMAEIAEELGLRVDQKKKANENITISKVTDDE